MLFVNVVEDGTIFSKFCEEITRIRQLSTQNGSWHLRRLQQHRIRVNKNDVCLLKPFPLYCFFAVTKQSSGRHKRTSRRSLSEAALHFGNICAYKPSSLRKKPSNPWKKPSNLQCSCAANTRLEKCSECRHHFLLDTYCTVKGSLEMHLCYLWGVLKPKWVLTLFVILSSGKVYSTHILMFDKPVTM